MGYTAHGARLLAALRRRWKRATRLRLLFLDGLDPRWAGRPWVGLLSPVRSSQGRPIDASFLVRLIRCNILPHEGLVVPKQMPEETLAAKE